LEQGLEWDAETRRDEVERVARTLPPGPVVVGGDLNSSTLNTPRRRLLRAGLVDLHRAVGSGAGVTRTRWRATFRIDWLLTSRDVTPVREWVDEQRGSDHSPVVADIGLPR
jgi:endonuclease/exonuclease/phosphatase (EEP) superfamily protein YafD